MFSELNYHREDLAIGFNHTLKYLARLIRTWRVHHHPEDFASLNVTVKIAG
jgi:hypothetical protein